MSIVEASPALTDRRLGQAARAGNRGRSGRSPEVDEGRIRRVPKVDIGGVHVATVRDGPWAVNDLATARSCPQRCLAAYDRTMREMSPAIGVIEADLGDVLERLAAALPGKTDLDDFGQTVNLAARVQGLAGAEL